MPQPCGRRSVVIFLPDLSGGGAERMHILLAPALAALGFDAGFLLHRRAGLLLDLAAQSGVRIAALGGRRSLAALLPLARLLRRERPDILIANLGHNNIIALWARALARVKTRVIAIEHNSLSHDCAEKSADWRYRILPWLYRRFLGRADAVVAVSRGVADDLTATAGIDRGKITVIENPVLDQDFDRRAAEPAAHPWLHDKAVPVFLGVGRFIPAKDFATLIRAFAIVARQRPARLILLGEGALREELAALAESEGVGAHVAMPGYAINPLPFMRQAAALVMSSLHEGFGNVLVEALGCGAPVVSTDCPYGPGAILQNGKYGRMVPAGDAAAMAASMLAVLDSPAPDRAILRARARDFSVEKAAQAYGRLFDSFYPPPDIVMAGQFPEDSALIRGGVQASTYGLARALHKSAGIHSLQVLALPLKPGSTLHEKDIDGINVLFLNAPWKFLASGIRHLPRALRLVRAQRNPVVHIHGTGLFQAALCLAGRLYGFPVVWTLHGITEKETLMQFQRRRSVGNALRYLLYRTLERAMLRTAGHVIVDTDYVRGFIPSTPRPVHVIPQGIFLEELLPLRARPKDRHLVLGIGVMAPRKGHHLLLEAFAKIRKNIPEARLVIAGALAMPEYFARLERLVADYNLKDCVTLAANLPRAAMLDYLGRARVFALHSAEESQGIALCEALAAGLPVVATRIGGIPHVVTEGKDGLLVDYGDSDGFAAAAAQLLRDDPLHGRMAAHAAAASERFAWNSIAARVAALYRQAAES